MRKLKLQMQVTADGFVAGPKGELNWMAKIDKDDKLIAFITHLTDTSDTILLGRKMTPGFIAYWESVKPDSPESAFARKMVGYPKVVFSKTVTQISGQNLRVEGGDLVQAVNKLKSGPGKDVIVYGGATFVGSLIENGLIDQFNFFVNPTAIASGMRIFKDRKPLQLTGSTAYPSGVVVNSYEAKR